jgi:hypothetical protein
MHAVGLPVVDLGLPGVGLPGVGVPGAGAGGGPGGGVLPLACRQRTFTAAGSVSEKTRQRYRWGTDEWIAAYARRTLVEGVFGHV